MITGTNASFAADIANTRRLRDALAHASAEVSANRRILRPSDDAAASARIATLRQQGADATTTRRNLDLAAAMSAQADSVLDSASALLSRARELTVGAANGTLNADDRAANAVALRAIADDLASLQTTAGVNGQPLFGPAPALAIPVGDGASITPVPSGAATFTINGGALPMADAIRAAATALEGGDTHAIGQSLTDLASADAQIVQTRAAVGLTGQRIDALAAASDAATLNRSEAIDAADGFDLASTMAEINARQLTLQAAQAVYARLSQSSLFDLLR